MSVEDLRKSKATIGAIYPILKTPDGQIIDGNHRSKITGWKTEILNIKDPLAILRVRVHANMLRRDILTEEKEEWVSEAFRLLTERLGHRPLISEVAEELGLATGTVEKYNVTRRRDIHASQASVEYLNACKECKSTQKECFSWCKCENCVSKRNRKASPINYTRGPVFHVKIMSNMTISIPAEIARRFGWGVGDVLTLQLYPQSIELQRKKFD